MLCIFVFVEHVGWAGTGVMVSGRWVCDGGAREVAAGWVVVAVESWV